MKRYFKFASVAAVAVAAIALCGFQSAPSASAYFTAASSANNIPKMCGFLSGYPYYCPSLLVDNGTTLVYNGNTVNTSATPTLASLGVRSATTAASTAITTIATTVSGVGTASKCTFSPANAGAGGDIFVAQPYVTATTNTVTLTATVGSFAVGDTYNLLCIG